MPATDIEIVQDSLPPMYGTDPEAVLFQAA
jgi:hypothetical protein